MKNIQLLNKIAGCGTDLFDKAVYNVAEEVTNPDACIGCAFCATMCPDCVITVEK